MTKRILSIEVQVDNQRIVRDLMASAGYQVIEAVRGDQGFAFLPLFEVVTAEQQEAATRLQQNLRLHRRLPHNLS